MMPRPRPKPTSIPGPVVPASYYTSERPPRVPSTGVPADGDLGGEWLTVFVFLLAIATVFAAGFFVGRATSP